MRNGDWIQTFTGKKIYPLDARADEIDIEDIAHSLAMQCRFNGHTDRSYPVAEHSCHVADLLDDSQRLAGLLHDASEAYLCDFPRPLKMCAGFGELYREAEDMLMRVIARRFGFQYPLCQEIEIADKRLLATEAIQLMSPLHVDWRNLADPIAQVIIPCWTPDEAKRQLLKRFDQCANAK